MIRFNEFYAWIIKLISILLPPIDRGARIRGLMYRPFLKQCGKGLMVPWRTHIFNPNGMQVGNNVYLGYNSYYGQGEISIGDNVLIGPFVSITASNHIMGADGSFRNPSFDSKQITIQDNVWIGAHVCILAGVNIGEGCIIAAGSVVTHNIAPYSVAVGAPAKVIRQIEH